MRWEHTFILFTSTFYSLDKISDKYTYTNDEYVPNCRYLFQLSRPPFFFSFNSATRFLRAASFGKIFRDHIVKNGVLRTTTSTWNYPSKSHLLVRSRYYTAYTSRLVGKSLHNHRVSTEFSNRCLVFQTEEWIPNPLLE